VIDVAIVGGGVAGCYCAYRLTHDRAEIGADRTVRVFEASNRIGGRLWSVPLKGVDGPLAEVGGMYFKEFNTNVRGLIAHLRLKTERVNFMRKHHFLRGKFLDDSAYTSDDQAKTPFGLRSDERGKSPAALLAFALEKIAPDVMDLWPVNRGAPRSPQATFRRLRAIRHQGQPLEEYGLWKVLADTISSEAHALLMSVWGSISLFRNVNAFDGIWNLLHEFGEGRGFRVTDGYQLLPLELQRRAEEAGATFRLKHRLRGVRQDGDTFKLSLSVGDEREERVEYAKRLILAMPRRALQLVSLRREMFADFDEFKRIRDASVLPMRSCKVFLTFDARWWEESIAGSLATADVAAAYTDLPMQQCYYFGGQTANAQGLLMAAYADDASASFWSSLASSGSCDFANAARNAEDALLLGCSPALVSALRRQLSAMHHDAEVPLPKGAVYFDWGSDPYGAAWHGWAPNFRSWEIRPLMRQPNPALDLFICGEAYSQRNGWVEGAINSAEKTLERFGLHRPEWITDPDFQFEIDDEGESENEKCIQRTALRAV